MKRSVDAGNPFFLWVNFTHMHLRTHTEPESLGQAGEAQSPYHDTFIDHDKNVGSVVKLIDELGIAGNTIVIYSTDNGPHKNSWPDAGTSAFRNEKNSGWDGGFRVPAFVRWRGKIEAGSINNDIVSHMDWAPTLLAAAGAPDVAEKLKQGYEANGKQYKVHLDGYNMLPRLTGQEKKGPRESFFYFSDDGDLLAMRYRNWKVHFAVQDMPGTMAVWQNPFRTLRLPALYNLRTDPYEQATITSNTYWDWWFDHAFTVPPVADHVGGFLSTFKEYPPRQKAASFTIGDALKKLQENHHQ